MSKTGDKRTAGYTLVEVIVAIAILGLMSVPICASLLLAGRLNAQGRAVMEAQLNVRGAVETLMSTGCDKNKAGTADSDTFPGVTVNVEEVEAGGESLPYCKVTVFDTVAAGDDPLVTVVTYIRAASEEGGGGTS